MRRGAGASGEGRVRAAGPAAARALLFLLAGGAAVAAAGEAPPAVELVQITTEQAGPAGTARATLGVPAICVGPEGLLLAVGISLTPPPDPREEAVSIVAIDAEGRRRRARLLGGDAAARCTLFRLAEGPFPEPAPLEAPSLRPGDPVRLFSRHGEVMGFAPRETRSRVAAVAERPARLYALEDPLEGWRSAVVTGPNGELLGFLDARPTFPEGRGAVIGVGESTLVVVPIDAFAHLARRPPEPRADAARPRAWLGVNLAPFDADHEAYFGLAEDWKGAFVTGVAEGSPAAAAGVRLHDLLRRIGDLEFRFESRSEWPELLKKVQALPVGLEVECEYVRFHEREEGRFEPETFRSMLRLGERPLDFSDVKESAVEPLGIRIKPATQDWLRGAGLPPDAFGLVVTAVEQGSPAQLAGIAPGDLLLGIDRQQIRDLPALEAGLAAAKEQKREKVVLFLRRGLETAFVAVAPNW